LTALIQLSVFATY